MGSDQSKSGMAAITREPYRPDAAEWEEAYLMLCAYCAHAVGCQVVEGMIAIKDGGDWPEGGWVTDPGAGITCLSYEPKPMAPLSRQRLRHAIRKAKPMCNGCAAQKGSEASVSLHTRRDFAAAVQARALFVCHEDPTLQRPCGGWCQAVKSQVKRGLN